MYEEFQNCFSPKVEYKDCVTSKGLLESLRRPLRGAFFVKNKAATVEFLPT
jgi:hypothetical protein